MLPILTVFVFGNAVINNLVFQIFGIMHCPNNNLNLRIKPSLSRLYSGCNGICPASIYIHTVYCISGPETRHILLYPFQPWQAWFLYGDSEYFWDSACSVGNISLIVKEKGWMKILDFSI